MPFVIMKAAEAETAFGRAPAAVPMAICDICEGAITDAGMAMYAWDQNQVRLPGLTTPFLIVHKGACQHQAQTRVGWESYGDMEFTHLLQCLWRNTRADGTP